LAPRSEEPESLARLQQLEARHDKLTEAMQDSLSQKSEVADVLTQMRRLEGRHDELVETVNERMCYKSDLSDFVHRVEKLEDRHGELAETVRKEVGRETSQVADLVKRLEGRHEDLSETVREGLSQSSWTSASLDRIQRLEEQTKDFETRLTQQSTAIEPAGNKTDTDLQERISEALAAMESGETATSQLHEEIRQEIQGIRAEVTKRMADEPVATSCSSDIERRLELNEAAVEQLRGQVVEQSGSAATQDGSAATSQRITEAEKAVSDLQKDLSKTVGDLETRLDKLQIDHDLLALAPPKQELSEQKDAESSSGQASELAEEALRKASGGEEAIIALRAELRGEQESLKELATQVREAVDRVEASEAATMAVREELMTSGGGGGGGGTATAAEVVPVAASSSALAGAETEEVEARVRELREEISTEVEALKAHQIDLARAREEIRPSDRASEKVERAVEDFARQVEAELNDLRQHQSALAEFKAKVERPSTAEESSSSTTPPAPLQVEAKISDLFEQVTAELSALTAQQHELGQAKTTLQDIAGQMKDVRSIVALCQNATGDLRQFVQGQSDDVNVPTKENSGADPAKDGLGAGAIVGGRSAGANGGAPKRENRGGSGTARAGGAGASDDSDGYGDEDFEHSAGLDDSA